MKTAGLYLFTCSATCFQKHKETCCSRYKNHAHLPDWTLLLLTHLGGAVARQFFLFTYFLEGGYCVYPWWALWQEGSLIPQGLHISHGCDIRRAPSAAIGLSSPDSPCDRQRELETQATNYMAVSPTESLMPRTVGWNGGNKIGI